MLRETLSCFIGRWTEVLDEAVSKLSRKVTLTHDVFAVATREWESKSWACLQERPEEYHPSQLLSHQGGLWS